MTNTQKRLEELKDEYFIQKKDAFELAEMARRDYTYRSKEGRNVKAKLWDVALGGGCPGLIFEAVEKLVERYN